MSSGWPSSVTNPQQQQGAASCAFTAQGDFVCASAPPAGGVARQRAGVEPFNTTTMNMKSLMLCPTSPFERPNCATECSVLVKNDKCDHLDKDTDAANYRKCTLCMQGCCRERGVPPHGLLANTLLGSR